MKIMELIKPLLKKQGFFDLMLVALLIAISMGLNQFELLQRWDNLFYDFESSLIERPADKNIVIVAIDDRSLQKLGRWPWSRAVHARFLDELTETGVLAIGFDVLFMEPDIRHPEDDKLLLEAIKRSRRVVLPVLTNVEEDSIVVTKSLAYITNSAQLSHVNMNFDDQGVARELDLKILLDDDQELPSMALALYQKIHKESTFFQRTKKNKIFINFSNPAGQFRQISYVDVLLDSNLRQSLQGKVILVGMTAAGLGSYIATPGATESQLMSGIEFQANALNTLQSGGIVLPLKSYGYWLMFILLIIVPVMTYKFFKPNMTLIVALGFSALTCISSFLLLSIFQLWFAPLSTLLCLVLSYPLWSLRKLKQLKRSLFKEHKNASAVLKAIEDAVVVTDNQGLVEYLNPAAEKMFAYSSDEVKTLLFSKIYNVVKRSGSALWDSGILYNKEKGSQAEIRVIKNRFNEEFSVRFSKQLVFAEDGKSESIVYALSDLTEMINVSQKIAFIAAHDVLTGLPNRSLLRDLMEQAIKNANRESVGFAVLFIDLDGFKNINDTLGHASGDFLLQEVARRLRNWVRQSDTISRWGGDEFIIMLDKLTSPSDVAEVVEQIKDSLSLPFTLNQQEMNVTPSIGISFFPDDGIEVDSLLEKADAAMYHVKKNGRNNFCFYSESIDTQVGERLLLEKELSLALKNNEFEVYYQPQFELKYDRLIGIEATIRWNHPKKGLLSQEQFIALSEETGLIVPIGKWLIKTVCRQIKVWKDRELPLIKIAINLSARQLAQKDLVSHIEQEAEKYGIRTDLLQAEISESMIIQDIGLIAKVMVDLKALGISIIVDKFGIGYSSFGYLKKLPIDTLKIDQSFISSVTNNHDNANIVQAVIAMGHNMNMQIIAEGVEAETQLNFLLEHKCDYAQGYLFNSPVSAKEIEEIIKKFRRLEKV